MVNNIPSVSAAVAVGDVGRDRSNGRGGFKPPYVERQGALS
jgi:hypothetical protein